MQDRAKQDLMVMASAWSSRPAHESYWGVCDALAAAELQESTFRTATIPSQGARIEAGTNGATGTLALTHPDLPNPLRLNNWSAGQICRAVGAPHAFLSTLAPTTAAAVLTERLTGDPVALANMIQAADKVRAAELTASGRVVLHYASTGTGKGLLRAITSESFTPVPNSAILRGLERMLPQGWRTPPARPSAVRAADPRIRPATSEDVCNFGSNSGGGLGIKVGDQIGPAGAYMSDRDLLVLLVNDRYPVDCGNGQVSYPFAIIGQGSVGNRSFWGQFGLLDFVCGNHILWGASVLGSFSCRHIGDADKRGLYSLGSAIRQADRALPSANKLEQDIKTLKATILGKDGTEVCEAVQVLSARKRFAIGQRDTMEAYKIAEREPRYGDPRSAWAVAQGLTELSQIKANGKEDERFDMDKAAGRLLDAVLS